MRWRAVAAVGVAGVFTVAAVFLFLQGNSKDSSPPRIRLHAGRVKIRAPFAVETAEPAPAPVTISTTLDRTASVIQYLEDAGLNDDAAAHWARVFRKVAPSGQMQSGHALTFYKDPDTGAVRGFRYNLDYQQAVIELALGRGVVRSWSSPIQYEVQQVEVAFPVGRNFKQAAELHGIPNQIVHSLEKAFNDRHSLRRLRPGSVMKLIYKEKISRDGSWRVPSGLEAAQLDLVNGEKLSAFAFGDGSAADRLYDAHGDAIGVRTLRFPVHFKYISSGFSFHRYHPLLHIYRPHLGVDLATDYGAPVKSVGDGRVVKAGWCGELGRCVRIQHRGDITSVYGHLSKINPKIHPGVTVHVAQVIGRVGSSGLSTGPHLHWAMEKDDRYVNPLTLRLGAKHPISPRLRAVFDQLKAKYMAALSKLPSFDIPGKPSHTEVAEKTTGKTLVSLHHHFSRHHHHHRHHHWRTAYRTAGTGGEAGGL